MPCSRSVGVVVVNYEAGPALIGCVASLRAAGLEEIVVVDNASRDGSLVALAAADSAVELVPEGRNLGYGAAVNAGVERLIKRFGEPESVLVCNPDLELQRDAVDALRLALETADDCAVVGPALYWPSGERYPSARAFPTYGTALAHGLLAQFVPNNRWSRRYRQDELALGATSGEHPEVDWVSGACFLVRTRAFLSVGGFDEAYFMYVEDLDLCWRLRRAGWSVRYVPEAHVVHAQGLSASRHPYRMLVAHHASTWRFARRRVVGTERLALPAIGGGIAARLGVSLARQALRRSSSRSSVH